MLLGYADNLYNYFIYYSHFLTWITIIFNTAAQPSHLACLNSYDIKHIGLMSELFINVHKIDCLAILMVFPEIVM